MTTNFRLLAASRTLSLQQIWSGTEDAAYEEFKQIRWENGEPTCPKCGIAAAYEIKTRRKFQCKACFHHFSVTSGTIFASRKISYKNLLAAICLMTNAAKGISSVQFSQDLNVQYKTAWVLAHKLREAMASEVADLQLKGEVEMDGAYFKAKPRKANQKKHRKLRPDGRSIQSERDRVVIAIRERNGRTRTFVRKTEKEGVKIAHKVVAHDAVVFTDEGRHWSKLYLTFDHRQVNHAKMYVEHGKHTNTVESLFSRMRRMIDGQHHGVSPQYLHQYAAHTAWLEDHRNRDNGANTRAIIANAMGHPVSRNWKGYWQRSADTID